jgi:hypothetical protein
MTRFRALRIGHSLDAGGLSNACRRLLHDNDRQRAAALRGRFGLRARFRL